MMCTCFYKLFKWDVISENKNSRCPLYSDYANDYALYIMVIQMLKKLMKSTSSSEQAVNTKSTERQKKTSSTRIGRKYRLV